MNRCIIMGAMSQASGGENTKLLTTTAGNRKTAAAVPAQQASFKERTSNAGAVQGCGSKVATFRASSQSSTA
jgi:hypothetical protein